MASPTNVKIPKVTQYVRNVGKSVAFASINVIGNQMPGVKGFIEDNDEIFREAYHSAKNYKDTIRNVNKAIHNSNLYKAVEFGTKNMIEDAKETHDESPVMTKIVYTSEETKTIFVFKHRDLATIIDRAPVVDALIERYGESAAILHEYVNEVYIKIADTGNADEDYANSTDPTIICEELYRLSTNELDEIRSVVEQIPSIEPIGYSMKGTFVCGKCGAETKNPPQDITSLVFQIALKARYFV